jgi:hypothetical protein
VYLHYVTGTPAPSEKTVWDLAERFGWTLEYVGGLSLKRLHEHIQIEDGKAKAKNSIVR